MLLRFWTHFPPKFPAIFRSPPPPPHKNHGGGIGLRVRPRVKYEDI